MTHTKGPWAVGTMTSTRLPVVMQVAGPVIAKVTEWTSVGHSDPDMVQANARLMAAAPDMYEAIRTAMANIGAPGEGYAAPIAHAYDILGEAIAKAETGDGLPNR